MASAGSGRKGRATQYDFNFTPGAPRKQIMELASLCVLALPIVTTLSATMFLISAKFRLPCR